TVAAHGRKSCAAVGHRERAANMGSQADLSPTGGRGYAAGNKGVARGHAGQFRQSRRTGGIQDVADGVGRLTRAAVVGIEGAGQGDGPGTGNGAARGGKTRSTARHIYVRDRAGAGVDEVDQLAD